jgi:hypothetical protein
MNLDYIEISKFISKDKINFDYLDKDAAYEWGAERYYFDRCKRLKFGIMKQETNKDKRKPSILAEWA